MTTETCCRFCDINLFCPNTCKFLRIKWFGDKTIIPSKPCMTCIVSDNCSKYINTQYELSLTVTNSRLVTPSNLEGEKMENQKVLRTEDYEMPRVVAGEIDESGIEFRFDSREYLDGKFGKFSRIIGTRNLGLKNEESFVMDYSGSKLTKLIDQNYVDLVGKKIKISAYGSKFDRQYQVEILN